MTDTDYRRQADFRYAIRRFSHFSEEQARQAGITPQQHLLLLTVRGYPKYPTVSIKDIADRLQIRHHSASLLIERMVKRHLVTRTVDPTDRRRTLISLTEEGLHILEHITRANRQELRALDETFFGIRDSLLLAFNIGDKERTPASGE